MDVGKGVNPCSNRGGGNFERMGGVVIRRPAHYQL